VSAKKRVWIAVGLVAVVVGGIAAWMLLPPSALSFAGGRAVSLTDYRGPSPSGVPAELRDADAVTRGRYLTAAADCLVCHTRAGGAPFAGGRAFNTPFGVMYSPNITPDRDTGIGAWTDTEFLRAVHEGIAKDGERLYPAFPYESYTLLTDEDVFAIKAYLFSLAPVRADIPPNSLAFPFNQRWLMAFWSAFYNPDQRFQAREERSPAWNRGAYLVEALAHCGDCHTPRNLAQALDNRHKFAGAVVTGWRAFNITPDAATGVGDWTDEALGEYLVRGHAAGHGSASGPMGEVVDFSLSELASDDVRAIVAYLRSVPPARARGLAAVRNTPAPDAARADRGDASGKRVFAGACASCHDWSGTSLVSDYATLIGNRAINDPSAMNVAQVVIAGAEARAHRGLGMPAFGAAYSDFEIAAVANYVVGRFGTAPARLTARDVSQLRELAP
jgi:mono/diheme cytochrome c family protein